MPHSVCRLAVRAARLPHPRKILRHRPRLLLQVVEVRRRRVFSRQRRIRLIRQRCMIPGRLSITLRWKMKLLVTRLGVLNFRRSLVPIRRRVWVLRVLFGRLSTRRAARLRKLRARICTSVAARYRKVSVMVCLLRSSRGTGTHSTVCGFIARLTVIPRMQAAVD